MENTNNTNWFLDEDEEFIFPSKASNDWSLAKMQMKNNSNVELQQDETKPQQNVQFWKVDSWKA